MPSRRRRAAVGKGDADEERGLAMRILRHSPKDLLAGSLAFAAVGAIVANAMFMQAGHHPSPMFGLGVTPPLASLPANPLPRPRPVQADTAEVRPAELRASETKAAETKADDSGASVVRPAVPPHAHSLPPLAPIPASTHSDPVADLINATRRIAAVQRTLTEYGYGQLKPTGTVGTDTQAAIRKFEQTRRMPVTGQMSDNLVRELVAMAGRPID